MNKKKKKRIVLHSLAASVKPLERAYAIELNKVAKHLISLVKKDIFPILKEQQSIVKIQQDGASDKLFNAFNILSQEIKENVSEGMSPYIAAKAVGKIAVLNENRFNQALPVTPLHDIKLSRLLADEQLDEFLKMSIHQNTQLISSIPEKFLNDVQSVVYSGYQAGEKYETIEKRILGRMGSVGSILKNRIKTIARNETGKINAQLTSIRSQKLGITKAIFQTSKDERVRESHKELNGKEYEIAIYAFTNEIPIDRKTNQQSCWTITTELTEDIECVHDKIADRLVFEGVHGGEGHSLVMKYIIGRSLKVVFLRELMDLGINGQYLFPGLDGLGKQTTDLLNTIVLESFSDVLHKKGAP